MRLDITIDIPPPLALEPGFSSDLKHRATIVDYPFDKAVGWKNPVGFFGSTRLGKRKYHATDGETKCQKISAALGTEIAVERLPLVYGGGDDGQMGVVSNACLNAGGYVHGVCLDSATENQTKKKISESWAERFSEETQTDVGSRVQRILHTACNGTFVMPGAYGTLQELFTAALSSRWDYQKQPIILLNVDGAFDPLLKYIEQAIIDGWCETGDLEVFSVVTMNKDATPQEWARKAIKVAKEWHVTHGDSRSQLELGKLCYSPGGQRPNFTIQRLGKP